MITTKNVIQSLINSTACWWCELHYLSSSFYLDQQFLRHLPRCDASAPATLTWLDAPGPSPLSPSPCATSPLIGKKTWKLDAHCVCQLSPVILAWQSHFTCLPVLFPPLPSEMHHPLVTNTCQVIPPVASSFDLGKGSQQVAPSFLALSHWPVLKIMPKNCQSLQILQYIQTMNSAAGNTQWASYAATSLFPVCPGSETGLN